MNVVDLHAEIVGETVRKVSDSFLVTLDASLSYNPNEPKNRQTDVNYIWECDVLEDIENCKKYVTAGKILFKLIIIFNSLQYLVIFNSIEHIKLNYISRQ